MSERTIDLTAIKEISNLGVRRAAAFMGLGLNAAKDERLNEYRLTNLSMIQILPFTLDIDNVNQMKDEFGLWIIKNGLRELIETFAVYLDKIYEVCLLMSTTRSSILLPEFQISQFNKKVKDFSRKGLSDKFIIFDKDFSLQSQYQEYLISINQARNSLAHRRGIIGIEDCKDCNNANKFILKWKRIELFVQKHSGQIVVLDYPLPEDGIRVEGGETVNYRFADKQLIFNVGDVIKLSSNDLAEICHFFLEASSEIIRMVWSYADRLGIEIKKSG